MKALFILMTIATTLSIAEANVVCHTPRLNKIFELKSDNNVTFFHENDSSLRRELASLVSRNKVSDSGVTKIVNFENQKHTIHINDMKKFSDADDYIIIKAKSGHETTYPLLCEAK
jgi:hypothetical protein